MTASTVAESPSRDVTADRTILPFAKRGEDTGAGQLGVVVAAELPRRSREHPATLLIERGRVVGRQHDEERPRDAEHVGALPFGRVPGEEQERLGEHRGDEERDHHRDQGDATRSLRRRVVLGSGRPLLVGDDGFVFHLEPHRE
jgi:hypothetical protein